jgi:hypothetical protein
MAEVFLPVPQFSTRHAVVDFVFALVQGVNLEEGRVRLISFPLACHARKTVWEPAGPVPVGNNKGSRGAAAEAGRPKQHMVGGKEATRRDGERHPARRRAKRDPSGKHRPQDDEQREKSRSLTRQNAVGLPRAGSG